MRTDAWAVVGPDGEIICAGMDEDDMREEHIFPYGKMVKNLPGYAVAPVNIATECRWTDKGANANWISGCGNPTGFSVKFAPPRFATCCGGKVVRV